MNRFLVNDFPHRLSYEEKRRNRMHPTGIEPALKASEASVLSIRLRVHYNSGKMLRKCYATVAYHIILFRFCLVFKVAQSPCFQHCNSRQNLTIVPEPLLAWR